MQVKTVFISVIFVFSFLSLVSIVEADWLGCRLGQWNNYRTNYPCTGGDYSTDCPSTYVSGNNCYYDYCYCGYSPDNYCVYDDLDSNKPSCPERVGVDTDKCLSGGHLECTSSGWECKYSSVTPVTPEGPPGDATCKDRIDNDCDGLIDKDDPDCLTQPILGCSFNKEYWSCVEKSECKWCTSLQQCIEAGESKSYTLKVRAPSVNTATKIVVNVSVSGTFASNTAEMNVMVEYPRFDSFTFSGDLNYFNTFWNVTYPSGSARDVAIKCVLNCQTIVELVIPHISRASSALPASSC